MNTIDKLHELVSKKTAILKDIKVFKDACQKELESDDEYVILKEKHNESNSNLKQKKLQILSDSGDYDELVNLKKELRVLNEAINDYSIELLRENGVIELKVNGQSIVPKVNISFTSKQLQLF